MSKRKTVSSDATAAEDVPSTTKERRRTRSRTPDRTPDRRSRTPERRKNGESVPSSVATLPIVPESTRVEAPARPTDTVSKPLTTEVATPPTAPVVTPPVTVTPPTVATPPVVVTPPTAAIPPTVVAPPAEAPVAAEGGYEAKYADEPLDLLALEAFCVRVRKAVGQFVKQQCDAIASRRPTLNVPPTLGAQAMPTIREIALWQYLAEDLAVGSQMNMPRINQRAKDLGGLLAEQGRQALTASIQSLEQVLQQSRRGKTRGSELPDLRQMGDPSRFATLPPSSAPANGMSRLRRLREESLRHRGAPVPSTAAPPAQWTGSTVTAPPPAQWNSAPRNNPPLPRIDYGQLRKRLPTATT